MIIENRNGLTILYSEGTNKITNKERTVFSNRVFVGKNKSVNDYEEVPKDIWSCYVKEVDPDVEVLKKDMINVNGKITNLSDDITNISSDTSNLSNDITNISNDVIDLSDQMMGVSNNMSNLHSEVAILFEENVAQDELILTSIDALVESYEFALTVQEDNLIQDELILTSMDALAQNYEQTLAMEESMVENTENVLISMDALAELYEMIINLTLEIESLKGGVDNGNSNE